MREGEDYGPTTEFVYFSDVREFAESYLAMDRRVDEDYTLRITIDVISPGDDEQSAELRAWELFNVLRRVLYDNHNLITTPGSLVARLGERTTTQTNIPIPGAWVIRIQVDQSVDTEVYSI